MKARWRLEHATGSNSSWFVGVEAGRVSVLAPPGVPVSRFGVAASYSRCASGWQWGVWDREDGDHWPVLDAEPPRAVREVSTRDVLQLLEDDLHELVWSCLWNQLQIARRIGMQRPDAVPSEDLARAGARATAWLRAELTNAFPDRWDELTPCSCDPALELSSETPGDPAELVPQRVKVSVMRRLAWRLLARDAASAGLERRVIWRAGDPLDGPAPGPDPGDLSAYGWGDESGSEYDIDLVTDAESLEARVEEGPYFHISSSSR